MHKASFLRISAALSLFLLAACQQSAIKDAIDRFRDKGRRCTMRDLYTVLVSLAGSWEDIVRNQGGEAQVQERDLPVLQREMDDPYDLTEYAMDDTRADGCAREHR